MKNSHELTAMVMYALTGAFVAVVGGSLRKAYTQLREQHGLLDQIHGQREDLLRALTHDIRSPLSVISMNAAMLGKCDPLVNLISNALKYSPGEVVVRARQQERNVVISVSDDGPGIAESDLPHIFEKYYRASSFTASSA